MALPQRKSTASKPTTTVADALAAAQLPALSVADLFDRVGRSLPNYKDATHSAMLQARISTIVAHIDRKKGSLQSRAAQASSLLAHYIATCHSDIPHVPVMRLCAAFQEGALAVLTSD